MTPPLTPEERADLVALFDQMQRWMRWMNEILLFSERLTGDVGSFLEQLAAGGTLEAAALVKARMDISRHHGLLARQRADLVKFGEGLKVPE